MSDPMPPTTSLTRRRLLRNAAIGGAVAWTAPVILSSPAGAQGTCTNTGVAWSDWELAIDDLAVSDFLVDPIPLTTTVMTVSYTDAGITLGSAAVGYVLISPLGAETTSYITIELDAGEADEWVEISFTFDLPVTDLAFTLLDIDQSTNAWQDEVTLTATNDGIPVVLGPTDFTLDPLVVQQSDVFVGPTKVADRFTGIAEAANNSTDANVAVIYTNPLNSLVLRYTALGATADPQLQQIGIADFSMCAV